MFQRWCWQTDHHILMSEHYNHTGQIHVYFSTWAIQHIKAFVWMITSDIVVPALNLFVKSQACRVMLANAIGEFLSIFGTTDRLIFMILVNSVTVISYLCNTNSYIQTCDNKSARTILRNSLGLIETLITITEDPQCLTLECVRKEPIERYVVLVYSNTSCSIKYINDARYFFPWKKR